MFFENSLRRRRTASWRGVTAKDKGSKAGERIRCAPEKESAHASTSKTRALDWIFIEKLIYNHKHIGLIEMGENSRNSLKKTNDGTEGHESLLGAGNDCSNLIRALINQK